MKLVRTRFLLLSLAAAGLVGAWTSSASAQYYWWGKYGTGGTWNLYEVTGGIWGNPAGTATWENAKIDAESVTTPAFAVAQGVPSVNGRLVSIHSKEQNDFYGSIAWGVDAWVGLTDNEAFGGVETRTGTDVTSSTGTPDQDGRRGLVGDPPDPEGRKWVWVDGSPFNFTNFGGGEPNDWRGAGGTEFLGEDAVHLRGDMLWNDNAGGSTMDGRDDTRGYIIEYPVNRATPTALPASIFGTPVTAGAAAEANGKFKIREVIDPNAGPGDPRPVWAINTQNTLPAGAVVREYEADMINILDTGGPGQYGLDAQFKIRADGALPPGFTEVNNISLLARGKVVIPEDGTYTFHVNSDDSFIFKVGGQKFKSSWNSAVTPEGYFTDWRGRGVQDSFGQIDLVAGTYDVELIFEEGGGGAAVELGAAKGAFTSFDATKFRPIGYQAGPDIFIGGVGTVNGWKVEMDPAGGTALNRIPEAFAAIEEARTAGTLVTANNVPTINYRDPQTNGEPANYIGNSAPFINDTGADDNDFALRATSQIVIPAGQGGIYTFGFATDDGAELIINGANFTTSNREGEVYNGTPVRGDADGNGQFERLSFNENTGDSFTLGETNMNPGTYNVEFITWERGGGAFAEVFGFKGQLGGLLLPGLALKALGDSSSQTITDINGLQLAGDVSIVVGDMDDSGAVDNLDIAPFALALTDPAAYAAAFPGVSMPATGDANADGAFDNLDIAPFVGILTGGAAAVPEPSTVVLAGLGVLGLGLARVRKARK